jgi:hypothetical protein
LPFNPHVRTVSAKDDGKLLNNGAISVEMDTGVMSGGELPGPEREASCACFERKSDHMSEARWGHEKSDRIPGETLDDHFPFWIGGSGNVDPSPRIPDRSGVGDSCLDFYGMQGEDSGDVGEVNPFGILIEYLGQ